ncbi:MAG: SDR family oxidoreductase [Candidatus Kapabacteria bacterium]|nr:SDR family oxidoreductase [Candidatus Kapabacteria bacterium]MDW8012339.1 SDR family oxidoreductase [Bacteroidota bacterium]
MPTAIITGGTRRLGKALAENFARQGWNVVIHYYRSEEGAQELEQVLPQRYGIRAMRIQADLRKPNEVWHAFREIVEQLGPPDVLVNNAAVFPPEHTLTDLTPGLWEETLSTNLTACLYTSQAFAAFQQGEGRIINVASLGGLRTWRHRAAYNVSKAALLQLTKNLALELAPRITVNAVCPGLLRIDPQDPEFVPVDRIPSRRYGNASDVFEAVYFFATATSYITGQWLIVDGGYHLVR